MERFSKRNVREILEMIEDELNTVPKLDKIQRMRIRAKIRQQENWLLAYTNPTAERILKKLEGRLADVLSLYPYGFSHRLVELLKLKVRRLKES